MRSRHIGMLGIAAMAAMPLAAAGLSVLHLEADQFAPLPRRQQRQVGDGKYPRSRGKPQKRKRHRNMLHVSKRVRRKHRRARK